MKMHRRIKELHRRLDESEEWVIDHEQEIVAMMYERFWMNILAAFLLSYIYRVPGGDGKLRPIDGWKINPYLA